MQGIRNTSIVETILRLSLAISLGAISLLSMLVKAHDAHLSAEPWAACDSKEKSEVCSFTNSADDLYRGTCQSASGRLICVRNKPIVKNSTRAHDHESEHEHR